MSISNLLVPNSYDIKAGTISPASMLLSRNGLIYVTDVDSSLYTIKYTGSLNVLSGNPVNLSITAPRIKAESSIFMQVYDNVPFVVTIGGQVDGQVTIVCTNLTNATQTFTNFELDLLIFDPPTIVD